MKIRIRRSAADKQWYWKLQSSNGKIVAIGGEGYHRIGGVENALRKVFEGSPLMAEVERALAEVRAKAKPTA